MNKNQKVTKEVGLLKKHIGFRVTSKDFKIIKKIFEKDKNTKSEIFRKFMFFLINNKLK